MYDEQEVPNMKHMHIVEDEVLLSYPETTAVPPKEEVVPVPPKEEEEVLPEEEEVPAPTIAVPSEEKEVPAPLVAIPLKGRGCLISVDC
jgi:hypothetical protein